MANTSNRRGEWEDAWREALEGAEASPSPRVWDNIESALAVQETGKYRRGFLFYRAIAATLLLLIAGLSWYIVMHQREERDAVSDARSGQVRSTTETPSWAPVNQSTADRPSVPGVVPQADVNSTLQAESLPEKTTALLPSGNAASASTADDTPALALQEEVALRASSPSRQTSDTGGPIANEKEPPVSTLTPDYAISQYAGDDAQVADDPLLVEGTGARSSLEMLPSRGITEAAFLPPSRLVETSTLYHVPQPLAAQQEKQKKNSGPSFYAGLALTPSYFDPQLQTSAPPPAGAIVSAPSGAPGMLNDDRQLYGDISVPPSGTDDTPEMSFTYGVDIGMKLSDRWVLSSGIDYNRFNTRTETRLEAKDMVSGNRYPFVEANRYTLENAVPISTTPVNNSYEFISVPLQVGYQVDVSKLRFTMSSGVAANFFLGNDISSPSSSLSQLRVSSTTDSPYRAVYYSGVLSGGVNYNVSGRYFVSLTPSYAFALTELTKNESALNSAPYSFGLNVGFQYQF